MRNDPANRIMSLSFVRDREEHADVMLRAGERFVIGAAQASRWRWFFGIIAAGIAVGLFMELYRRFILPMFLDASEIAPLTVVGLQMLPVLLIASAVYAAVFTSINASRRQAVIDKLAPQVYIDVDVYKHGISLTSTPFSVEIDWLAVRDIETNPGRIEIASEGYIAYIPRRAFVTRKEFDAAGASIRGLWREARKRERDEALLRVEKQGG